MCPEIHSAPPPKKITIVEEVNIMLHNIREYNRFRCNRFCVVKNIVQHIK